nr:hypothetical protein [Tanacetum cinerariifolium]
MSANDKFGLGYGDYKYGSILSYKNEVLQSVFMNKASDLEDTSINDRYADGMHAVPPPIIGNYMPSGPDVRLVTQGYRQEEGIDYDEVFALVARIEAIRIFLAFVSYMGFIVYQMDMKSAFLYDTIDEEVYVTQPPGFVDPKFPNKVYKVRNARFTPSSQSLQDKKDIMLVQVYVDDIIFGSTNKSWCDEFEELMKNRFQMSSMGELTFFLRLQVKQKEDGIFISQDKYVTEILKKFDFLSVKTASNPIETKKPLVKDKKVVDVDILGYLKDFTPLSCEENL